MQHPVQNVGDGVMALNGCTASAIHRQGDFRALRGKIARFGGYVQPDISGFLGVGDGDCVTVESEHSSVADLTAHFSVHRRAVEDDAGSVLPRYKLDDVRPGFEIVEADELGRSGRIYLG